MSWWLILILIVVALVVLFIAWAFISEKNDKKNAPVKLKEAQAAFNNGNMSECMKLLRKAFYVPSSSEFTVEEAKLALEAVLVLEKVIIHNGNEPEKHTKKLKEALSLVTKDGSKVDERLTKHIENLLDNYNKNEEMMNFVKKNNLEIIDKTESNSPEFTNEELDIVNRIGKLIMSKKIDDAINLATSGLETSNLDFKADLLNQRGSCYFMKKNFESAKADYLSASELQPDKAAHVVNLAEAYEKLGMKDLVVENATKALSMSSIDKYERSTAEKLLKKHS